MSTIQASNSNTTASASSSDSIQPLLLLEQGIDPHLTYQRVNEMMDAGYITLGGDYREGDYGIQLTDFGKRTVAGAANLMKKKAA